MAINVILPSQPLIDLMTAEPKLEPHGSVLRYETPSSLEAITLTPHEAARHVDMAFRKEVRNIPRYGRIDRIELFRNPPGKGCGMALFNRDDELVLHIAGARLGTIGPGTELGMKILHEFCIPDVLVAKLNIELAANRAEALENGTVETYAAIFARLGRPVPQVWTQKRCR